MRKKPLGPADIAKRISSLVSGFFFEIGFILLMILFVLGITAATAFILSLVG